MIGTYMIVRITDEFNTTWSVECPTDTDVTQMNIQLVFTS